MNYGQKVFRIFDANLNRVREGLRVCEDVARFIFDDRFLTTAFKNLRHECSQVLLNMPELHKKAVLSRDSEKDVGKKSFIADKKQPDWNDLMTANIRRVEEALRVLEEISKLVAEKKSNYFQRMRFKVYGLEKKVFKRI